MPTRVDAVLAERLLASPLKYILSDVDGVILSGSELLPGIPHTLQHLLQRGKQIRFLSNNASLSRRQILQKFERMGIHGFTVEDIYNSGYATALRLQQLLGRPAPQHLDDHLNHDPSDARLNQRLVHGNLFVIGEPGLHEELRQVLAPGYITYGLELHDPERVGGFDPARVCKAWEEAVLPAPFSSPPDPTTAGENKPVNTNATTGTGTGKGRAGGISLQELNAQAVVVGLDRHFSMLKLAYAGMILRGPPARLRSTAGETAARPLFIATNEDPQIPIGSDNILAPGAGCIVRAVVTFSGREPDAVCGKPEVDMARVLFAKEGIQDPRASCLMVGDRLITDVAFGNAAGCQTMLVLSGTEGMVEIEQATAQGRKDLLPDFVADSLACFMP